MATVWTEPAPVARLQRRLDGVERMRQRAGDLALVQVGGDDLDVAGRRVLVRSDLNVPLADGPDGTRLITDDGRIRASVPTIRALADLRVDVVFLGTNGISAARMTTVRPTIDSTQDMPPS